MKTSKDVVALVCKTFVARAQSQGLKGKARDRAAIEYLCGAAALADAMNDKELYHPLSVLFFLTCVSGYEVIEAECEKARS